MAQKQIQKAGKKQDAETAAPIPAATARDEKHLADLDALLDEIDAVLEENAEEFVRGYIQKGGE